MSLATLLTQTATVTPRTTTTEDIFGDPQVADGTPVAYPCRLEQPELLSGSVENRELGDRVVTHYLCYMPPDAVIGYRDKVTIAGQTFEVDGEPATNRSPDGAHHKVVSLRDVLGG